MAKQASKTQSPDESELSTAFPVLFPIDRLMDGNGRHLEAWTRMSRTLMESVGALQVETTRFLAKRLDEDMSSHRELAGCRSPSEALEVCNAFGRKALQDYLEEATRVSDIAAEMSRACAAFGETMAVSAVPSAQTNGAQANGAQAPAAAPTGGTASGKPEARPEIAA